MKSSAKTVVFPVDIRTGHLPVINQKTLSVELNISESWLKKELQLQKEFVILMVKRVAQFVG